MSMAAPFLPEPAHDQQDEPGAVPESDVLTDADTADGAPVDETVPDDDVLADPADAASAADDNNELDDALAAEGPKGYRSPEAGDGLSVAELRSDLAE